MIDTNEFDNFNRNSFHSGRMNKYDTNSDPNANTETIRSSSLLDSDGQMQNETVLETCANKKINGSTNEEIVILRFFSFTFISKNQIFILNLTILR
jgi:hypothetical protein